MEYPTSSVRIQYTTVSVGITSPGLKLFFSPPKYPQSIKNSSDMVFKWGKMPIQSGGKRTFFAEPTTDGNRLQTPQGTRRFPARRHRIRRVPGLWRGL